MGRAGRRIVLSGLLIALLTLVWLASKHAAPAFDSVPILGQSERDAGIRDSQSSVFPSHGGASQGIATASESANTSDQTDTIDCRSPATAKAALLARFDQTFGREMTELHLSGAVDWPLQHPPDISQGWYESSPDGVAGPASYNAYTKDMLRTTADNGDALAAALYGARLAMQYLSGEEGKDESKLQEQLILAERYLQQGVQGHVSGALAFLWQIAELRVNRDRKGDENGGKPTFPNRNAVIELHARTLLNQTYGTFDERISAYTVLIGNAESALPPLENAMEHEQVQSRLKQLQQPFQKLPINRSEAEQRAERAAIALVRKSAEHDRFFDALRCADGSELKSVVSEDVLVELLEHYEK